MNKRLTFNMAHILLDADFEAGMLTWKKRHLKWFIAEKYMKSWNTKYANKKAGNILNKNGKEYRHIEICGYKYLAHRVLFLMNKGYWPLNIDHQDGNGLNNRWDNIRNVAGNENHKNRKLSKNNSSGVCGVGFHKRIKKWRAFIQINKKSIHLGYFIDFSEAKEARKAAERKYNFHHNHGQIR